MRFLADENFNNDLLRALKKQRPDVDIVRVQDTEIYRADDPTVLDWAANEQRIVLTHDVKSMTKYAYDRVIAGLPMPGIIEVKRDVTTAEIINDVLLMIGAGEPADFENQVRYVPMR
jgi:predicted nuclease of predicted toxin-antitoxin system